MKNPSYEGKMVLIAWEHRIIPEIAEEFGVMNAPKKWPGEVFDRLWVIDFEGGKPVNFRNLPQRLMFGDSPS